MKRLDCFGRLFLQDSKETYNVGHVGNKAGMEPIAVLCIQNAEATVFISCPSVQRDFYPGVEPQNSSPPYVLNVTDEDGQPLPDLSYYGGDLRYNGKNPSF